ncbi:MAG: hypothetical protein RBT65_07235 [Methanolobus sp.]|jgi:sodium/pantothenate symporter|nr:hypothetical protein [Methanolobus sp.]
MFSQKYDARTIPQLLECRYDSQKGKVLLAGIMLLMYTVYLVAIFKGCANLFQGLLGVTYVQGLFIAVVIVVLYYVIGGLPAIIWIRFFAGAYHACGCSAVIHRNYFKWWRNGNMGYASC